MCKFFGDTLLHPFGALKGNRVGGVRGWVGRSVRGLVCGGCGGCGWWVSECFCSSTMFLFVFRAFVVVVVVVVVVVAVVTVVVVVVVVFVCVAAAAVLLLLLFLLLWLLLLLLFFFFSS